LAEAMQHAEDLAHQSGVVELWAQHSDRLARGDGRLARHVVEIGLWALKRDVTVRTVQDPDTFRDLLYAVVTGQRNYEDSRRKSLSVAAGQRRAVGRGQHIGVAPDGYRIVVAAVDERGAVTKRLVLDPERQPMIELLFRLALRGTSTGAVARKLNDAGWRTNPNRRGSRPRTWTNNAVRYVLRNPRYAGLAAINGEVLWRGHWPAYISERQHERLVARLAQPRLPMRPRPREAYLFAGLARCAACGSSMHVMTGRERQDGTFARRYVCVSRARDCSTDSCKAPRLDADMVEAMFVSALPLLFGSRDAGDALSTPSAPSRLNLTRERIVDAARNGDDEAIDRALGQLLQTEPDAALAARTRRARQHELTIRCEVWIKRHLAGRTEETRTESRRLNGLLRHWFAQIAIVADNDGLSITSSARRQAALSAGEATVSFVRREWPSFLPVYRQNAEPRILWRRDGIVAALKRWQALHGQAPRTHEWESGSFDHPNAETVRNHFGTWRRALQAAGMDMANPRLARSWSDAQVIRALQHWAAERGCPPKSTDWRRGTLRRPSRTTVYSHFGSWSAALVTSGLSESDPK
jgi:Recombinase/Recombinase zinc beta ribbon domain/Homing endonuclease associated repeat